MTRQTYITIRRLAELEATLTPRDRAILRTFTRVRVATAGQLERLHGEGIGPRQTRQVLASLTDRRLLARSARPIGGIRAGSGSYIYSLDVAGLRLMRPGRRAARPWPAAQLFLAHGLDVAALYVDLVEKERSRQMKLAEFSAEPAAWRWFYGPGGVRMVLKPDAFIRLQLGDFEDCWFIEVDRGTESLPTVARKCLVYRRYWQNGSEQARHGVFPRVLWIVPDARRAEAVTDVCGRQPAEAWQLFTVATRGQAVARLLRGAAA
jgi:hypothetical protein